MPWETFSKQAEANLAQARAQEQASGAMHFETKRTMCKESVVLMVLESLEAWYVADCDAEVGVCIAGQIVRK